MSDILRLYDNQDVWMINCGDNLSYLLIDPPWKFLTWGPQIADIGYQTIQHIIKASEPLKLAQEINQNFPKLVSSLSRMPVTILPFTMYPGASICWNIEMRLEYTTAMLGGCGCSAPWDRYNMPFSAKLRIYGLLSLRLLKGIYSCFADKWDN